MFDGFFLFIRYCLVDHKLLKVKGAPVNARLYMLLSGVQVYMPGERVNQKNLTVFFSCVPPHISKERSKIEGE